MRGSSLLMYIQVNYDVITFYPIWAFSGANKNHQIWWVWGVFIWCHDPFSRWCLMQGAKEPGIPRRASDWELPTQNPSNSRSFCSQRNPGRLTSYPWIGLVGDFLCGFYYVKPPFCNIMWLGTFPFCIIITIAKSKWNPPVMPEATFIAKFKACGIPEHRWLVASNMSLPWKRTNVPWKWMVERCIPYWNDPILGGHSLVFGGISKNCCCCVEGWR